MAHYKCGLNNFYVKFNLQFDFCGFLCYCLRIIICIDQSIKYFNGAKNNLNKTIKIILIKLCNFEFSALYPEFSRVQMMN